jgi:hypothetical protein
MIHLKEPNPLETRPDELDMWFLALEHADLGYEEPEFEEFMFWWYVDLSEWAGAPMNPGPSHAEIDAMNRAPRTAPRNKE